MIGIYLIEDFNMDWFNLIYTSPFFALALDYGLAYLLNSTPYLKRLYSYIKNIPYKVQIMGVKKYNVSEIDIKDVEKALFKEYSPIKIISRKTNSLVILIENMQAPYEILITTDEGEFETSPEEYSTENIQSIVDIVLMGSIEFRYRGSDDNDKYFNVLNKLFDIIEHTINEKPIYSFFTLQADLKNEFQKRPFITEHDKDECEDTKLDIDKSLKFIKINSKTKDNLYKCLKKNIHKVL